MTLGTAAGREMKAKFSPLTKLPQNYIFTCLKEIKKKKTTTKHQTNKKESTMLFISDLDSSPAE
jgi:cytochrome c553